MEVKKVPQTTFIFTDTLKIHSFGRILPMIQKTVKKCSFIWKKTVLFDKLSNSFVKKVPQFYFQKHESMYINQNLPQNINKWIFLKKIEFFDIFLKDLFFKFQI